MGSPASTRSPSLTSHSASTPSYPAETLTSSRRLRMEPSGVPAGRCVPSATSAGLTVPRTGETTTRQSGRCSASVRPLRARGGAARAAKGETAPPPVGQVLSLGAPVLGVDELARAVEVGGGGERQDLGVRALPLPLGQPGQRARRG